MTSDDDLEATERMVMDAYDGWDKVPAAEVQRARDVFALRDVDAELASLVDEIGEHESLAGARSVAAGVQDLTFGADDLVLEVELTTDAADGTSQIAGQIIPPATGTVATQPIEGSGEATTIDELGRFLLIAPGGPMRLVLELVGRHRPIATEFFRA